MLTKALEINAITDTHEILGNAYMIPRQHNGIDFLYVKNFSFFTFLVTKSHFWYTFPMFIKQNSDD